MDSEELNKILSEAVIALMNEENVNNKLLGIIRDFIFLFENEATDPTKTRYYETIQTKIANVIKLKKMLREGEEE